MVSVSARTATAPQGPCPGCWDGSSAPPPPPLLGSRGLGRADQLPELPRDPAHQSNCRLLSRTGPGGSGPSQAPEMRFGDTAGSPGERSSCHTGVWPDPSRRHPAVMRAGPPEKEAEPRAGHMLSGLRSAGPLVLGAPRLGFCPCGQRAPSGKLLSWLPRDASPGGPAGLLPRLKVLPLCRLSEHKACIRECRWLGNLGLVPPSL